MKNWFILTLALVALIGPFELRAEVRPVTTPAAQLDACRVEFKQALDVALYQPERAKLLFRACALKLDTLGREHGAANGAFYYTLGSTWYLAGDIGQAMLALRRAERLLPHDADVAVNLAQARAARHDELPASFAPAWLVWLSAKPLTLGLLQALFIAGWLTLWATYFWPKKATAGRLANIRSLAVVLALLGGIPLLARSQAAQLESDAIITDARVIARKGDAFLYQAAFTNELTAGTEVRVLERRADWWQVSLSNGTRCWVPANALTAISAL